VAKDGMESVGHSCLHECFFQAELWEKCERRRKEKINRKGKKGYVLPSAWGF